jgi:transposase-like protein
VKAKTVMALVRDNIQIGSTLMTDKFAAYDKARKLGYRHQRVDHGRKQYVKHVLGGKAHTNTIEGFWSSLKRGVDGTHHSVSPKMLQTYVDFYAWHWNRRNAEQPLFQTLLAQVA